MRNTALIAGALSLFCTLGIAQEPVWYPPTEPSPFVPDDARFIGAGNSKLTHFRGRWELDDDIKRAVLCTAPRMTVALYLEGKLIAEGHDTHQATPVWVDVTDLVHPGTVRLAAKVHSEWTPQLYVQMRVEYDDGTWKDCITDLTWEWCEDPPEGWEAGEGGGEWGPVTDQGGYAAGDGAFWGRDFAVLPREVLQKRFAAHNQALRGSWAADRAEVLRMDTPPERPEWAAQFADFSRIDPATGQLRDGSGRVRHPFFTIYGQSGALGVTGWDLDQLEADLDLMVDSGVNLYVRMLGWGSLLDENGDWARLEKQPSGAGGLRFDRTVDLLDHFVRRAWAHGRYIVFEGDFYWSAHPIVPPPYRARYHLYPEVLEAQALATRKIMARYSQCPHVLGMMIGEEDIVLEHDLDNPHQKALFADFLARKYGTLEEFRRQTPWGYDYADRSAYVQREWTAEHWPGRPRERVLVPGFRGKTDPFADAKTWDEIPLPLWPWQLSITEPHVRKGACTSHNQFSPEDPLWIDFYEMREDELLFNMLVNWARIVRQAMPDQLLFYSNAQDLTASWHFLHLYRRAELPFDVIGVGCHDSNTDLADLPPWATVRKAIKVISAYRPYALSPGSPAVGIASGEGEGGNRERPQEILNYYRGALFDEIGGGVAWTQTYAWEHMSGAHGGAQPHKTPVLEWMGEFMPATEGVEFPLDRPVQVLIVRNTNLAHSNMSGLDYGNVQAVAEFLTQLNVEFDIVQDRDLVYAPAGDCPPFRVDLSPYRLVIVPQMAIDFPASAWTALDAWLNGAAEDGPKVLALGWVGKRGPRLEPKQAFHPVLQRWVGMWEYAGTADLKGKQTVELVAETGARELTVDFGSVPPVGTFDRGEPVLRAADGSVIGARTRRGYASVFAFGFPLGFAHEPLWGLEPKQEPRDAMAPLFDCLASEAWVDRPVVAPHNVRVYLASRGEMILIRERAGIGGPVRIGLMRDEGRTYPGLELSRGEDGFVWFTVDLAPWEGKWYKAEG